MTRPPLVSLDIESDGIHPGRNVWEIGMIRRTYPEAGPPREFEVSLFVEIDLSTADPFGLQVGRFYERHPAGRWVSGRAGSELPPESYDASGNYRSRRKAAEMVARATHGAHLLGMVPNFDTETLDPMLREHGHLPGWHYHLTDAETLIVGYLAAKGTPKAPPWSSSELSAAIGVDPPGEDERHTALGDARWALNIWDKIMGDVA